MNIKKNALVVGIETINTSQANAFLGTDMIECYLRLNVPCLCLLFFGVASSTRTIIMGRSMLRLTVVGENSRSCANFG